MIISMTVEQVKEFVIKMMVENVSLIRLVSIYLLAKFCRRSILTYIVKKFRDLYF